MKASGGSRKLREKDEWKIKLFLGASLAEGDGRK